MIDYTFTNEEKLEVTLAPLTKSGKPAKVQAGSGAWTVTSGDGTVDIASNTFSAFLVSGDTVSDTVYHVEADADLGEGVTTISEDITIHVVEPSASTLGITAGIAVPK